jgi:hypothetical protein
MGKLSMLIIIPWTQVHEAELAHELASKRIEAEEEEKKRIAEELSATKVRPAFSKTSCLSQILSMQLSYAEHTSNLLTFLRFHAALAAGQSEALAVDLDESSGAVVSAIVDALLGQEGETKQEAINGFLSGEGDFQGISCKSFSSCSFVLFV